MHDARCTVHRMSNLSMPNKQNKYINIRISKKKNMYKTNWAIWCNKTWLLASSFVCLSVRMSTWKNTDSLDKLSTKSDTWRFFESLDKRITVIPNAKTNIHCWYVSLSYNYNYYYYTICMSPVTGISSRYFSWTSGDPYRSGFKLHIAVLSVLCVMFLV